MKRIDIKKTPLLGVFLVSGRRGSNSQQPAWKAGTLPIELLPHKIHYSIVKSFLVTQLEFCGQATLLRKGVTSA